MDAGGSGGRYEGWGGLLSPTGLWAAACLCPACPPQACANVAGFAQVQWVPDALPCALLGRGSTAPVQGLDFSVT